MTPIPIDALIIIRKVAFYILTLNLVKSFMIAVGYLIVYLGRSGLFSWIIITMLLQDSTCLLRNRYLILTLEIVKISIIALGYVLLYLDGIDLFRLIMNDNCRFVL